MEKKDEEMLVRFMHEQKKEVEDNGFSRKVMRRLPQQHRLANRIFNILCTGVCLLLFYLLDGVAIMFNTMQQLLASLTEHNLLENISPAALCIAWGVLVIVGIAKVCSWDDE